MNTLSNKLLERICALTKSSQCTATETVQSLWSGYGSIEKVTLANGNASGTETNSFKAVVKFVNVGARYKPHPRGWDGSASHARKIRSYEVEHNFYRHYSSFCDDRCRVAKFIAAQAGRPDALDGWLMVLEDLDAAGFPVRKHAVTDAQLESCLDWLANFHATFLHTNADRLWPVGTYWHLATRGEEFRVMENGTLKNVAKKIDQRLNQTQFQTLVHGDAKIANFCFPTDAGPVAAVDFQYVGRGCGMKDVAYLFSSCLSDEDCQHKEDALLTFYFKRLQQALTKTRNPTSSPQGTKIDASNIAKPNQRLQNCRCDDRGNPTPDANDNEPLTINAGSHDLSLKDTASRDDQPEFQFSQLEAQWRTLYPVAWADFYRFLAGWSPGHWKMNRHSARLTQQAIELFN